MYFLFKPLSDPCTWVFETIGISGFFKLFRKLICHFYRTVNIFMPTGEQLIIKHSITSILKGNFATN